jgi:hypothetical protein
MFLLYINKPPIKLLALSMDGLPVVIRTLKLQAPDTRRKLLCNPNDVTSHYALAQPGP